MMKLYDPAETLIRLFLCVFVLFFCQKLFSKASDGFKTQYLQGWFRNKLYFMAKSMYMCSH